MADSIVPVHSAAAEYLNNSALRKSLPITTAYLNSVSNWANSAWDTVKNIDLPIINSIFGK